MSSKPARRFALLAAALTVAGAGAACARRAAWTPVATNSRYPVEVDSTRIRPLDGAIEVWARELYPKSSMHSIRERQWGVQLNCATQQWRLIDVFVLSTRGTRHRDSVVAGAVSTRYTPERAADRPWVGAYRLPFKAAEVCERWGAIATPSGS